MKRDLDGTSFTVMRDGKEEHICFSDMTYAERDEVAKDKSAYYWQTLAYHLADVIKELGDELDIVRGDDDEIRTNCKDRG